MKTFRIWKSTGEPETFKANKAVFERTKDGLSVKFDDQPEIHGVVALVQDLEPDKFNVKIKHEN